MFWLQTFRNTPCFCSFPLNHMNSRRKCNHGRHIPIRLLIENPAVVFIGEARENQLPISFRANSCNSWATPPLHQSIFYYGVTVGMPVTRHPPYRSVRAALPHTAPALSRGESYLRERLAYSEVRDIFVYDPVELFPRQCASFLTSSSQYL